MKNINLTSGGSQGLEATCLIDKSGIKSRSARLPRGFESVGEILKRKYGGKTK